MAARGEPRPQGIGRPAPEDLAEPPAGEARGGGGPPRGARAAGRRWSCGATGALLVLAAAAVLGAQAAVVMSLGSPCPGRTESEPPGWRGADEDGGGHRVMHREAWDEEWPEHVLVPWAYFGFVAWCAVRRGRFEDGTRLHVWTWRYGYSAALGIFSFLALPADRCYGPVPEDVVIVLAMLSILGTTCLSMYLTLLKLRALGFHRLARAASVSLLVAAVGIAAGAATFYLLPEHEWLPALFLVAIVAAIVSFVFCAVRGLLAGAARIADSDSPLARGAARWVRLTAGAVLASALSMCLWVALTIIVGPATLEACVAYATDVVLNSLVVALLSGLEGPGEVRQVAEEAFEQEEPPQVQRAVELQEDVTQEKEQGEEVKE